MGLGLWDEELEEAFRGAREAKAGLGVPMWAVVVGRGFFLARCDYS